MKAFLMVSVGLLLLAAALGWIWLGGHDEGGQWTAEGLTVSDRAAPDPAGEAPSGPAPVLDRDEAPVLQPAGGPSGRTVSGPPTLAQLRAVVDRPALEALAERLVAAVEAAPDDGALLADLCEVQRLLGKLGKALASGRRAVAAAPDSSRAHHQYAKALAMKSQRDGIVAALAAKPDYEAAMERALSLDPGNLEAVRERIAYLSFVPTFMGGDPDEALRMARELQGIDPPWGLVMEVLTHAAGDDDDQALAVGRQARERFPGDQRLAVTVAGLLEDADEDEQAHALWEQVLEGPRSESWWLALWARARLHLKRKTDLEGALAAFERFVDERPYGDMIPPLADVHARRGEALEALDRLDEAADAYQLALALEADHDRASEGLERLDGR